MTNECYFKTNKLYQPTQDPFFVVQGMQKVQQFSVAAIKCKNTFNQNDHFSNSTVNNYYNYYY